MPCSGIPSRNKKLSSSGSVVCLAVLVVLAFALASAQTPKTIFDQMTTVDHWKQPGWWPGKGDAARGDFVGPAVCAECHQQDAAGQSRHSMATTAMLPSDSAILKTPAKFQIGTYFYDISKNGTREIFSVSQGSNTISEPLTWAIGSGSRGQSYLFQHDKKLYEARISFFPGRGFDITPGHPEKASDSIEFAIGRVVPHEEEIRCFGCHTVASSTNGKFDPDRLMPGISCEGCHGPGGVHVALASTGASSPGLIYNPAHLTAPQSVDFCGACHRTWWDVSQMPGINTLRFPAFRLEKSKCWGNGDKRLTCAACHNPHQPLQHDAAAYDSKCLACHQASPHKKAAGMPSSATAKACPVGNTKCVDCHMPKIDVPSMRTVFTEHKIQIVADKRPK